MGWLAALGAGLTGAGSAYSAYESARSVRDTNAMNQLISREQMQFSAEQAQKQMDFQERMSGTAHQREVADLRAAGINPLLSANAGASSPGGASGSGAGISAMPVPPVITSVVNSAKEAVSLYSTYKSAMASAELAKTSAKKAGVETDLLRAGQQERNFDEKIYKFLNGVLDGWKRWSAKMSNPKNWFYTEPGSQGPRNDGVGFDQWNNKLVE